LFSIDSMLFQHVTFHSFEVIPSTHPRMKQDYAFLKSHKMKKLVNLPIWVCLVLALTANARPLRLTLQEALDRKIIKGEAESLGGHSGACMQLCLRNLSADPVIIIIEPGRRLKALDENNQDILIVKEETVHLKSKERRIVIVTGFCCEKSDLSPDEKSKYALNTMADSALVRIARHLDSAAYERATAQSAVWAISDNVCPASVSSETNGNTTALRRLVCALRGEEFPWYTLATKQFTSRSGIIHVANLELKGTIPYAMSSTQYVTCYVRDEKGTPVALIKSDWLLASQQGEYELRLPVNTLADGNYRIELHAGDGSVIAERKFRL
jgi:hypothetical protein